MALSRIDHRARMSTNLDKKVKDVLLRMNVIRQPVTSIPTTSNYVMGFSIHRDVGYSDADCIVSRDPATIGYHLKRGHVLHHGISEGKALLIRSDLLNDRRWKFECGTAIQEELIANGWSGRVPSFSETTYIQTPFKKPIFMDGMFYLATGYPWEGVPCGSYTPKGIPLPYQFNEEELNADYYAAFADGRDIDTEFGRARTWYLSGGFGTNDLFGFNAINVGDTLREVYPNMVRGDTGTLRQYIGQNIIGTTNAGNTYVACFSGTTFQLPDLLMTIPPGSKIIDAKVEVYYSNLRFNAYSVTREAYLDSNNKWTTTFDEEYVTDGLSGMMSTALIGKVPAGNVTYNDRKYRVDKWDGLYDTAQSLVQNQKWSIIEMTDLCQKYVDTIREDVHFDLTWLPGAPDGIVGLEQFPYEHRSDPANIPKVPGVDGVECFDDLVFQPYMRWSNVRFDNWSFRNIEIKFQYPESEKLGVVSYRNVPRCDTPT